MRISDWSSDVCSSDLGLLGHSRGGAQVAPYAAPAGDKLPPALQRIVLVAPGTFDIVHATAEYRTRYGGDFETVRRKAEEIGRASCRERVGPYVLLSVVSVSIQKKKQNTKQKNT